MDYNDKLRDPRWQKRRLEIMERDNFTCQICGSGLNDGEPLNVHHKKYINGKEIWEYSDGMLITLCEKCHKKVHDGEIVIPEPKKKGKSSASQSIFYNYLFKYRDKLSGTDAITYSNILKMSVYSRWFEREGDYIKMRKLSATKLAEKCHCSERNIHYSLKTLRELGFIKEDAIYCPEEMTKRYIKIPPVDLKGWQLVFYSLLKERADYFGGSINTWASKLAEMFSTTKSNAKMLISILKKKGYVYRASNGRLVVR